MSHFGCFISIRSDSRLPTLNPLTIPHQITATLFKFGAIARNQSATYDHIQHPKRNAGETLSLLQCLSKSLTRILFNVLPRPRTHSKLLKIENHISNLRLFVELFSPPKPPAWKQSLVEDVGEGDPDYRGVE
jgi:hypothetical protein